MTDQTAIKPDQQEKGRAVPLASWKRLYAAVEQIKALGPWDYLWESDIITLVFPDRQEPVFCSVAGLAGQNCSIAVYAGYEQMAGFYRQAQLAEAELPYYIPMNYINCLICHFGERQELTKEDIEQVQQLGIKYHGKNQWPYFRSYRTGFFPWQVDPEEADLMARALEGLGAALQVMQTDSLEVDFDGGETLFWQYDEASGAWRVFTAPMPPIPMTSGRVIIEDEPLLAELLQREQTEAQVELELFYIPVPMEDERVPKPFYPRMAVLADRQSQEMLDQQMLELQDKNSEAMIGLLLQYILEYGRPASVFVRDDIAESLLWDLCTKLNIQLEISSQLPAVEAIEADMIQFVSRG